MSETATAKRTAGALAPFYPAGNEPYLVASGTIVVNKVGQPSRLNKSSADAAHIAACWNAVEAIGGDPATVAELVAALSGIEIKCAVSDALAPVGQGRGACDCWACVTMQPVVAVLAKLQGAAVKA